MNLLETRVSVSELKVEISVHLLFQEKLPLVEVDPLAAKLRLLILYVHSVITSHTTFHTARAIHIASNIVRHAEPSHYLLQHEVIDRRSMLSLSHHIRCRCSSRRRMAS